MIRFNGKMPAKPTNRLYDFECEGQVFEATFNDDGICEKVFIWVGFGFVCDLLDVTAFVTEDMKERLEKKYQEEKEIPDLDGPYESAKASNWG